MKRRLMLLLSIIIITFLMSGTAYASDVQNSIPITAEYKSGNFRVILVRASTLQTDIDLVDNDDYLYEKLLDDDDYEVLDKGEDIEINIKITPIEYSTDMNTIITTTRTMKDDKNKVAVDISVIKQCGEIYSYITEVEDGIDFSLSVPDDFDRTKVDSLELVSIHEITPDEFIVQNLDVNYNDDLDTVEFNAKKFSSFILLYDKIEEKPKSDNDDGEKKEDTVEEKKETKTDNDEPKVVYDTSVVYETNSPKSSDGNVIIKPKSDKELVSVVNKYKEPVIVYKNEDGTYTLKPYATGDNFDVKTYIPMIITISVILCILFLVIITRKESAKE